MKRKSRKRKRKKWGGGDGWFAKGGWSFLLPNVCVGPGGEKKKKEEEEGRVTREYQVPSPRRGEGGRR